ncbi:hypothetical protein M0P65_07090 [Candidatus Gracilibacteria bacterium]|jgi:hypothetical protein|nr:hypothetical protein [Candidatus Gracilibacteria bacterium]
MNLPQKKKKTTIICFKCLEEFNSYKDVEEKIIERNDEKIIVYYCKHCINITDK